MRYLVPALIIIAGVSLSCAGSRKIDRNTSVINTKSAGTGEQYTLIYSIPKTTLKISVETTKTIVRRGPYYQYAEKYLGISEVHGQDHERWTISNVNIEACQEADPDQFFLVRTNDGNIANYFRLMSEGFLLPLNQPQLPELEITVHKADKGPEKPLFTDLSIHPRVVEETRTVMRMVRQDTAFVNVPVLQRQSVTKTLEVKAAEAADLIFELRSNRFKLLSGDLDLFPDGKAMEAIIEEFARLEREYLALFTGRVFETVDHFTFYYSPEKAELHEGTEKLILFRFSESSGITPRGDTEGRPVTLELTNEMKTSNLEGIQVTEKKVSSPGRIFYRVPDVAKVRLLMGTSIIASRRIPVSQYGKVISVPADFLWD